MTCGGVSTLHSHGGPNFMWGSRGVCVRRGRRSTRILRTGRTFVDRRWLSVHVTLLCDCNAYCECDCDGLLRVDSVWSGDDLVRVINVCCDERTPGFRFR